MRILLIAAVSYLLGSIPFGYLLVRIFRGEDVRQSGSGNIGATNVARKSPLLGILTLLLDAGKGAAAVLLSVYLIYLAVPTRQTPYPAMSLAALFAVIGHIFPIWLKFHGGKGVATGLGAFVVIAPKAVLISACIFVAVVLAFRYVSLGSIIAVTAFPFLARVLHEYNGWMTFVFMGLASLLIVIKHHKNISRLLAGTENRLGAKNT
jgi:acyl phosphate:glycerol-3-phosphate acyltransferase